ncbi:MAG TPA: ribonuclease III [Pyrinomonadaceae bacterium]|nr:ribonuclease III [Pyrinomonadaceae bacterium]
MDSDQVTDIGERSNDGRAAATPNGDDLAPLERSLAHAFTDRALLERALTHRSWAHEHVGPGGEQEARRLHNEALEFVGDSVLGLVVAEMLFRSNPEVTEGELSRMKHRLVSAQTLARAATRLGFGQFLRVGRGEEKTGGRRKRALLADVFEAVLAAVYLDGGLDAAREFVARALEPELDQSTPESAAAADYKTMLQEVLQASRRNAPHYNVVETHGPPHRRTFHVEVSWDGGSSVRGEGHTIKAAEIEAARRAIEKIQAEEE